MRPPSACVACRDRRKRCHRPRRGTSCTFCIARGLQCTVEQTPGAARPRGYEPLVSPGGNPGGNSALMPDRDLCNELVDLYFRYIHVTFHNLFHRPSFEHGLRDGSIPKILVFAVFGLSARFSSHPSFAGVDPRERGRPYAKEAERLLDLHKTCLTTIQACVLLGAVQVAEMDSATESIFYTIACRLAMILDLPNAPAETRLEQEVNLRVWWSVVTTDTWSSTAMGLPRAIQPRHDIPMPMDERVFLALTSADPPVSQQGRDAVVSPRSELSTSLIAQMIKLNGILYDINTFNTQLVSGILQELGARDAVTKLSAALDAWRSELPTDMEYTRDNLLYWAGRGCGASFVVLHLNYNHSSQLLFYSFLHSSLALDHHHDDASTTPTSAYAAKCKSHAASLCEIMYAAAAAADAPAAVEVLYPLAGHMLVVASTVHLHALLFSADDAEIALAKARLEHNFGIITRLQTYWPSLHASFSRLAAFHRACLDDKSNNDNLNDDAGGGGTFRLDRWMLRFLLDFAKPVGERDRRGREVRHRLPPT
ncbi:hypothetical protein C8A01DRAFT_44171 [Parachaetomium inaequale]|uniref:Zn(2)-C6 fungal-type domain-containing protein n=1 Tax=Parachaetomium inaequale TaxID=2588326 RepID=A0AAN6PKT0_9PEZI|nr:hypothetical protein C8A01DRAFT_44171 [Parachaetomium inaequale]